MIATQFRQDYSGKRFQGSPIHGKTELRDEDISLGLDYRDEFSRMERQQSDLLAVILKQIWIFLLSEA